MKGIGLIAIILLSSRILYSQYRSAAILKFTSYILLVAFFFFNPKFTAGQKIWEAGKAHQVAVTNAAFALHDGSLFPSLNPSFLAANSGSKIHLVSFYRRLRSPWADFEGNASNIYDETTYLRDNSSYSIGISRQNHSVYLPFTTVEDPAGSIKKWVNITSTKSHIDYSFAIEILPKLLSGGKLSFRHSGLSRESIAIRDYPGRNKALSLDLGFLYHPRTEIFLGLYVSEINTGKVDYIIFDAIYSGKLVRGPVTALNVDLLYLFGKDLELYLSARNLFEGDLQQPKTKSVFRESKKIADREVFFYSIDFDGFRKYPTKRSFYGSVSYQIAESFALSGSVYRVHIDRVQFDTPNTSSSLVVLEPWTVSSIGVEKTFGKFSVLMTYVIDRLKNVKLDAFDISQIDQSFAPIALSISWQL